MNTNTRFSNLANLMGKLDPRSLFSRVTGERQESKSKSKLSYTLEMVFLGIISGCKTRRELETVSSDLGERLPHSTIVGVQQHNKYGQQGSSHDLLLEASEEMVVGPPKSAVGSGFQTALSC